MGDDSHYHIHRHDDNIHGDDSKELSWWQYSLLGLLLIAGFLVVYKIHYSYDQAYIDPHSAQFMISGTVSNYPFPYHADEWSHLAQAQYIMTEHKMPNVNPYLQSVPRTDLEGGFHTFLASLFTLSGLDPIKSYQFLPAIMMIITMLSIFLFLYVITKNYFIALLGPAFLLLVRSNINILGPWFSVPMTFSLFFIFMFFASYLSRFKMLSIIFFVGCVLTYPIAAIIIAITLFLYELVNILIYKKMKLLEKKYWKYYIIAIVVLSGLAVLLFKGNLSAIPLIFKYGWTINFEQTYMPWDMYGAIACIIAVIGLVILFWKKLSSIFWILPLIFTIPLLMYMIFRFTILIPYQRAFFYFLISLTILSAIGASYICRILAGLIKKPWLSSAIMILLLLVTFIMGFSGYYRIDDQRFRLVHYIEQRDVNAFSWIKGNYDNVTIMADMFTSFTIYPLSGMQVIGVAPSNLEVGDENAISDFFYNAHDCSSKFYALSRERPKLVYSYEPIDCNYLKEKYSKDGIYIYEASY